MHQQKLIQVLSSLTKLELKACRIFLGKQIPANSEEYRLFNYIWKYRKNWSSRRLKIEEAIWVIKRGATIKKFETLMSSLTLKIEKFILGELMDSLTKKFENQYWLAEFYRQKGLEKYFLQAQRKQIALLDNLPRINSNLPLFKLRQMHQIYFSNLDALPENVIEQLMDSLDTFYQQKKMVYQIELENQSQLYTNKQKAKSQDSINLTLEILQKQLALLTTEKEEIFFELNQILMDRFKDFSAEEAYRLHTYLLNYCSDKIRTGAIEFLVSNSQLINFGLKKRISFYNGKLSESAFLNIIIFKSREPTLPFQDIADLIEDCEKITNTTNLAGLKNFSYILYYFIKEDYPAVIEEVDNELITKLPVRLFLRAELIRLLCQYCTDRQYKHPDALIRNCRNHFKKNKSKIEESFRLGGLNLIHVIESFWLKGTIEEVKLFLQHCGPLSYRSWVHKELKKLAQNNSKK